ncbi:hypothetical protein H480_32478, partial [Amycolatopsis vancoresmycina DSM 44592]
MVEHERRGEPEAGCGAEAVAQLDRGQRVEAEFGERAVRCDVAGGVVAEHRGHVVADQVQETAVAFGRGQGP